MNPDNSDENIVNIMTTMAMTEYKRLLYCEALRTVCFCILVLASHSCRRVLDLGAGLGNGSAAGSSPPSEPHQIPRRSAPGSTEVAQNTPEKTRHDLNRPEKTRHDQTRSALTLSPPTRILCIPGPDHYTCISGAMPCERNETLCAAQTAPDHTQCTHEFTHFAPHCHAAGGTGISSVRTMADCKCIFNGLALPVRRHPHHTTTGAKKSATAAALTLAFQNQLGFSKQKEPPASAALSAAGLHEVGLQGATDVPAGKGNFLLGGFLLVKKEVMDATEMPQVIPCVIPTFPACIDVCHESLRHCCVCPYAQALPTEGTSPSHPSGTHPRIATWRSETSNSKGPTPPPTQECRNAIVGEQNCNLKACGAFRLIPDLVDEGDTSFRPHMENDGHFKLEYNVKAGINQSANTGKLISLMASIPANEPLSTAAVHSTRTKASDKQFVTTYSVGPPTLKLPLGSEPSPERSCLMWATVRGSPGDGSFSAEDSLHFKVQKGVYNVVGKLAAALGAATAQSSQSEYAQYLEEQAAQEQARASAQQQAHAAANPSCSVPAAGAGAGGGAAGTDCPAAAATAAGASNPPEDPMVTQARPDLGTSFPLRSPPEGPRHEHKLFWHSALMACFVILCIANITDKSLTNQSFLCVLCSPNFRRAHYFSRARIFIYARHFGPTLWVPLPNNCSAEDENSNATRPNATTCGASKLPPQLIPTAPQAGAWEDRPVAPQGPPKRKPSKVAHRKTVRQAKQIARSEACCAKAAKRHERASQNQQVSDYITSKIQRVTFGISKTSHNAGFMKTRIFRQRKRLYWRTFVAPLWEAYRARRAAAADSRFQVLPLPVPSPPNCPETPTCNCTESPPCGCTMAPHQACRGGTSQPITWADRTRGRGRPANLPEALYYERQVLCHCNIHALNMLLKEQRYRIGEVFNWIHQQQQNPMLEHHRELWQNGETGGLFTERTGALSPSTFAYWLFACLGLNMRVIWGKPDIATIDLARLDTELDRLKTLEGYQFDGFLVGTVEAAGYGHSSTLIRHQGQWYWLDPEKTGRACVSGTSPKAASNLAELRAVACDIAALHRITSFDECRIAVRLFPPDPAHMIRVGFVDLVGPDPPPRAPAAMPTLPPAPALPRPAAPQAGASPPPPTPWKSTPRPKGLLPNLGEARPQWQQA